MDYQSENCMHPCSFWRICSADCGAVSPSNSWLTSVEDVTVVHYSESCLCPWAPFHRKKRPRFYHWILYPDGSYYRGLQANASMAGETLRSSRDPGLPD